MITYVTGDATHPRPGDYRFIVHCCNDKGAWGSGFVLAVDELSPDPRHEYRKRFAPQNVPLHLGEIQVVPINYSTAVVNLIGQHGTVRDREHPIRYDAIYDGLVKAAALIRDVGGTVHMPRMGAGLAGGSWPVIEALINEAMPDIDVFVYDLPQGEVSP